MIAEVVFCCVAANHLGLIEAIESTIGRSLPVVNCSKCFTFWASFAACLPSHNFVISVAIAFACAYVATWAELAMGVFDTLYIYVYESICNKGTTDTQTTDNTSGKRKGSKSAVSGVRQKQKNI